REAGYAEDSEVVRRVESHDRRRERLAVAPVDLRLLDPGHDVRVRDHDARSHDPARALDAETARDAGHTDDARRSTDDIGVAGQFRVRRRDDGRRSEEDADRIDALERREETLRRELVVDPREDRGLLHRLAEIRLARQVEEDGADRPAE